MAESGTLLCGFWNWLRDSPVVIRGRTVYLRAPTKADFAAWAEVRAQSKEFLSRWEPRWHYDHLTPAAFRRRLRWAKTARKEDRCHTYLIFHAEDDRLLGGLVVENIRRWPAASGAIGYWIGEAHARQGYMSDAVDTIVPFAFTELGLSRIEAACLPENVASQALLRRCGFVHEGRAPALLEINGCWREHDLFARLRADRINQSPAEDGISS